MKLVLLSIAVMLAFYAVSAPRHTWLNYYLTPIWSMYLPLAVIGVVGATHHRARHRGGVRSSYAGHTNHQLVVVVPSLIQIENLSALIRVISSILRHAPRNFTRFRVDIVAESSADTAPLIDWLDSVGALGEHVRILSIPASYQTPNGARFKTRANHYALEARRLNGEHTQDTYVYHLDDDTHVGQDTIASLAEFIETHHGRFLLAQGVLAFPHELTPSRFCRLADSIRPADDLTRFAFFTGTLGTPLGGLHGEHLIIRADIEDEIGWDFPDTVIEDAYFAIEFAGRYPGRSTTLNSYSYGASPCSIPDLIRQRRRWIEGLLRLAVNRRLSFWTKLPLAYAIFTWALAPLQFVGLILLVAYLTGIDNTSPISGWVIPLWAFSLAYILWEYFEGLKVNLAASRSNRGYGLYSLILIPFVYLATPIETVGVVLGFVRFLGIGRQQVSEVITKPF